MKLRLNGTSGRIGAGLRPVINKLVMRRTGAALSHNLTEWTSEAGSVMSYMDWYGTLVVGGFKISGSGAGVQWGGSQQWGSYHGGTWEITWDDYGYGSTAWMIYSSLSSATKGAAVWIKNPTNTANITLLLQGKASQTGDLLQFQDSAGTALSKADSAGRFLAPLGALATCGYAFLGDPNTGLFSTSADDVSVAAGGVDRLRLNGTGVGFFAATPVAQQAHVNDPSGGATVDAEARTAVNSILDILQAYGLMAA